MSSQARRVTPFANPPYNRNRGSLICPTSPASRAKTFIFRFSEIHGLIRPSRFHLEGRLANRHKRWNGMRWTCRYRLACDVVADEQNRVVLISRRWDQVCRRSSADDGGYQARHSGESAE